MTACLCPMCASEPAPTYTPEHMRACLIEEVAARDPAAIKAFLALWQKPHPTDTTIRDAIAAEWRAHQQETNDA